MSRRDPHESDSPGFPSSLSKELKSSHPLHAQKRYRRGPRSDGGQIPVRHVICGDALSSMRRIPDGTIGMTISDPPFFIGIGRPPSGEESWGAGKDPWNDLASVEAAAAWARPLMAEMRRVTRKGGAIVVMAGVHASAAWMLAAEDAGLVWMAELTVLWNVGKPRRNNFGSLTTHILWFTVPGARHVWHRQAASIYSNVLVCDKIPVQYRHHPAQKPIELTNFLVSLLSRKSDVVLDPFCGSGSTLVSAEICERDWIGIDQDEKNCRTAARRVEHWEVEDEHPLYLWVNGRLEEP